MDTGACPACGAPGSVTADGRCPRGFPLPPLGAGGAWLPTPPGVAWPDRPHEHNPFLRWRELLWSYRRARTAGWTDEAFVALVERLDTAVAEVEGHGFSVRPDVWVPALADAVGVAGLAVHDETGSVGGSHKARHLMGLALHLAVDADAGGDRLAIASCGNAALGAATVARAADRPLDVFIPTWADPAVVASLERLRADIHVCERRPGEAGDPCMLRFQEAVAAGAVPFGAQASENRWTLDGGRTLGWELATAWAAADATGDEPVPDLVVVQVGGGALLTSCAMGLLDAVALGVLPRPPRIVAVQTEGCAPFDRAWRHLLDLDAPPGSAGADTRLCHAARHPHEFMAPWPTEPHSAATGILDDVTYDWVGVARALLVTGGDSVVVPEAVVAEANRLARTHTAIPVDATGTAGLAGLVWLAGSGALAPDTRASVLFTGIDRSAPPVAP